MLQHIPSALEVLVIIVVFFLAGFAWAAGNKVFSRLFG